jgi:hypothetical protein
VILLAPSAVWHGNRQAPASGAAERPGGRLRHGAGGGTPMPDSSDASRAPHLLSTFPCPWLQEDLMDMPMVPAAKAVRIVRGGGPQLPSNPPASPSPGQSPSPAAAPQPPPTLLPLLLTPSPSCNCRRHIRTGQGGPRQVCSSSAATQPPAGPHRQAQCWWWAGCGGWHGEHLGRGAGAHPCTTTTSSSRRRRGRCVNS